MPPSLEKLDLASNQFTGGIPTEWSSLTNLKDLNMANCGLDGTGWIGSEHRFAARPMTADHAASRAV